MKVLYQVQGLINDNYKTYFKSQLPNEIELIFPGDNKAETLERLAGEADVFIGYSVTKKFLENAVKLRHIQIPWTGFNSLDTTLLSNYPSITISNSHSNSLAIAEHAVALLFSTAKLIVYRDGKMREGSWQPRYTEDNSHWLSGKKLGIIGYGAIGKKVAQMLKSGFAMEVLTIKRNKDDQADDLADFHGGPDDLAYVMSEADYILVAVPLTDETKNLISTKELSLMKDSAIIVNIARGPVINEKALYDHLKESKIGGAGLDVWYNYPENADQGKEGIVRQNFPFESLDNVVMSPHSAFKVRDREKVFAQDIIENIKRIYQNIEPINQVNLKFGY